MKSVRFTIGLGLTTLASLGWATIAGPARADELITNGGFETGSFSGWSVVDQAGGYGSFFVDSGMSAPLSAHATVGPASGQFYAVTDQDGPGAHVLYQPFTVPAGESSVMLSFDMFVNDWSGAGPIVNPAGLDYTADPNQHARVDLLDGSASPFDTGPGVIRNVYLGVDGGDLPNSYTHYAFDITPDVGAGGQYILRFAEVDNQFNLNQGVDNVSIEASASPEPGSLALLATGGLPLLGLLRRRVSA